MPPLPSMSLNYGYTSSRFGEFLLIGEQSCDDPQIVPEHGPRDGEVTVFKSTAAQPAALPLLDDGDAALDRTSPTLQPGETRLCEALSQLFGIFLAIAVCSASMPPPATMANFI